MAGRWRTCGDERVCEACQTQEGGEWTGAAGVPPHPGCTNPDGCRCVLDVRTELEVLEESLGVELEVLEESGDPSIIATPRLRTVDGEESARLSGKEYPIHGSGFLGSYHGPPPPPAPRWRVLVWFLRDELARLGRDVRFRWERAERLVAEELEERRQDANRD